MKAHFTRYMDPVANLAKETVVGRAAPALQRGDGGFVDWFMLAIIAQRECEETSYRSVVDKLKVMERIRDVLGLDRKSRPDPSSFYKVKEAIPMVHIRTLLQRTPTLFDVGDVATIDMTSVDRVAASRRYARETDYRFLAMKTTLLTDSKAGAILDIACITSRPYDS